MGGYLSIPNTVRKVLYVEPSAVHVNCDKNGPEVKNGEWVVNEEVSRVENMLDDTRMHESDVISEAPISESIATLIESPTSNVTQFETKEELQREIERLNQEIDRMTMKPVEVRVESHPNVPPPITIPEEEERIPEFRNQSNSTSHAIKKFNRRHRKN